VFNVSAEKVLVVLVVALALLGPDKLPQAARQYGKFMATVHRLRAGLSAELDTMVEQVTNYDRIDNDRAQTAETQVESPLPLSSADAIGAHVVSTEREGEMVGR